MGQCSLCGGFIGQVEGDKLGWELAGYMYGLALTYMPFSPTGYQCDRCGEQVCEKCAKNGVVDFPKHEKCSGSFIKMAVVRSFRENR